MGKLMNFRKPDEELGLTLVGKLGNFGELDGETEEVWEI